MKTAATPHMRAAGGLARHDRALRSSVRPQHRGSIALSQSQEVQVPFDAVTPKWCDHGQANVASAVFVGSSDPYAINSLGTFSLALVQSNQV